MEFRAWLRETRENISDNGFRGLQDSLYPVYYKGLQQVSRFQSDGTHVYDREWDLLIVLDGCRVDAMEAVSSEYDHVSDVDSIASVNTMTLRWMEETFCNVDRSFEDTTYVCGNPFSENVLSDTMFDELDEVWRYAWDDEIGTIPPRPLTDRTIQHIRSKSTDRVVVHYMQPHHPFIPRPDLDRGKQANDWNNESWESVWTKLQRGDVTEEEVRDAYHRNLEVVLDDIELLLNNVDADSVAITSDHGNAFGEWNVYGHPMNMPLRSLREVPWVETAATDSGAHEPAIHDDGVSSSVKDRLNQLGYK